MTDEEEPSRAGENGDAQPLEFDEPATAESGSPGARPWWSRMFTPKGTGQLTDPEVARKMRTLDRTERRWSYVAAGMILLLSCSLIPNLLKTTYGTPTTKPSNGTCPTGYKLVGKTCETIYHPSHFVLFFCVLFGVGAVLLLAVWLNKRSLVIFTSIFVALGSFAFQIPVIFLVGMALGVWLLIRSWRLQRYGTTDGKEIRKEAVARTDAKREAKKAAKAGGGEVVPARSAVSASKRYTPKSKPRRK